MTSTMPSVSPPDYQPAPTVLPRPDHVSTQIDLWIDEAIWGHRLYDEQVPWLTVLECLGVAFAEHREGRMFEEPASRLLKYRPAVQLRLRNILFNSPRIALLAEHGGDDATCWATWFEEMRRDSSGFPDPAYEYVRAHFESFRAFAEVVKFLRGSNIQGPNNKRWSSQFLFPFGPCAVYEDLDAKKTSYSIDRRFFQRTGELLYLMLARSGAGPEIRQHLEERFINATLPFQRLVSVLQGEDQLCLAAKEGPYLPYASRPEYARLAQDWLALFRRSLPGYDVWPHLVTMSGLNLLLYFLGRAREEVGEAARPELVLEIVSAKKTDVRELSAESFSHNNLLPQRALAAHIGRVTASAEWGAAMHKEDPVLEIMQMLRRRFLWEREEDATDAVKDPHDLVAELQQRALTRHRTHTAKIHSTWGKAIGLVSRRLSRRTRYAPTDALLKTLVVCCVEDRMEFSAFVELLYVRYGLVIGDRQAAKVPLTAGADLELFHDNVVRLEERLTGLGLVRRLSDQCAYVENPFAGRDA